MTTLHLGVGTTRGALTVFPIWTDQTGERDYLTELAEARVEELEDGGSVGHLAVTNPAQAPLLLFEGQVLVGGKQNRMVAETVLIPAAARVDTHVVCVEHGRWDDGHVHRDDDRRASARVRTALRDSDTEFAQGEVWSRVSEYADLVGHNATDSYADYAGRAERVAPDVTGLRPLRGQVGILVGIGGQPVLAEVFDHPDTLAQQWDSLLRAVALDAIGQPEEPTPARRARRFLERSACLRRTTRHAERGLGERFDARNEYAVATGLRWQRRDVHLVLTNPRHPLHKVAA